MCVWKIHALQVNSARIHRPSLIAERIAAEKAKAETETQALAAADAKAHENLKDPAAKPDDKKAAPIAVASSLGKPAAGGAKRTRSNGIDKITITLPGASAAANDEITKLGGPKAAGARKADPTKPGPTTEVAALSIVEKSPGPQAQFLHAAHAAACRIFGTTLGPEANADHRNHFHVDMAERKYKKICD
jgi:Extensin-like protein C-terminus